MQRAALYLLAEIDELVDSRYFCSKRGKARAGKRMVFSQGRQGLAGKQALRASLQKIGVRQERSNLRDDGLMPMLKSDVGTRSLSSFALHHTASQPPSADAQPQPSGRFAEALRQEYHRVNHFYRARHEQLWNQLLEVTASIKTAAAGPTPYSPTQYVPGASPAALRRNLDSISAGIVGLSAFVHENAAKAAAVAQAADEHSGSMDDNSADQLRLDAATRAITGSVHLDSIILGLSDAYDALRCVEQSRPLGETAAKWVAPQHFTRVTRKFWLRPEDVTLFKTEVVKHLPVLVYGNRPKLSLVEAEQLPCMPPFEERDSGEISSVYLDAFPDCPSYHSRLRRDDNATAVRVRWYGRRDLADPHQEMFVERKVHKGKWTGEKSVKDRAAVKQYEVPFFLAGQTLRQGQEDRDALFLKEVQSHVVKTKMEPALRTVYQRTAFQEESNNLVRISMDTGLTMLRDGREKSGAWCRNSASSCDASDHFPYAVVEVKLQAPPGQWLKDLVSSGILVPAPKFSKFQHGMAMLSPGAAQQAPYWFLQDEEDSERLTLATWEEMAAGAAVDVANPSEWLYPEEPAAEDEENQADGGAQAAQQPMQRALRPMNIPSEGSQTPKRSSWQVHQAPAPEFVAPAIIESNSRDLGDSRSLGNKSSGTLGKDTPSDPSLQDVETGKQGGWVHYPARNGAPALAVAYAYPPPEKKSFMQRVFKGSGQGQGKGGESAPPAKSGSIKARQVVRTRVEPKTHFANERTFLQWLSISILVMILAMSMLSGSSMTSSTATVGAPAAQAGVTSGCAPGDKSCFASKLSGAIIAPVALAFMAYALFQYKKRSYQIMMQETVRYDDQRGPVVLVVVLLGALITSYVVTMIYVF